MKGQVIIFSGALFDSPLWTNRQNVATRLAKRGWKVLYVEPRLFLPKMMFGKFPGTKGRLKWFWRSHAPWKVSENLWVVSQFNMIPKSREYKWVSTINHSLNNFVVHLISYLLGFENPAILIYDTEAEQYLKEFPNSRIVYDCVDDHKAQAGVDRNPRRVEEEEAEIVDEADAVSVTSENLYFRFKAIHKNTFLVPNAGDVGRFIDWNGDEPADLKNIPHPRIGTVGAIDTYKIDVAMLERAATFHPEWHFILVGPKNYVGKEMDFGIKKLEALSNVHFLSAKPAEEVPCYVKNFDVAVIPYRESEYNKSSFPLKFWEFIASGTPVVATGLPSLEPFKNLFEHVLPEDFEKGIESALNDTPEKKMTRIEESKKHSWDSRVDELEKILA